MSAPCLVETDWCRELYQAHAAALVLYGRALGLSHSEAEDVLQETFLALLRRGTPPETPEHYCVRAYRHRALNYRRSLWRRLTRELEASRWFDQESDDPAREQAAMRCMAQLPREQREAIVLHVWHRMTFAEIAAVLDESPHTVAGRYRYGLAKIRAAFSHHHERLESLRESTALLEAASALPEG